MSAEPITRDIHRILVLRCLRFHRMDTVSPQMVTQTQMATNPIHIDNSPPFSTETTGHINQSMAVEMGSIWLSVNPPRDKGRQLPADTAEGERYVIICKVKLHNFWHKIHKNPPESSLALLGTRADMFFRFVALALIKIPKDVVQTANAFNKSASSRLSHPKHKPLCQLMHYILICAWGVLVQTVVHDLPNILLEPSSLGLTVNP